MSRTLESNTGVPGELKLINENAPEMGVIMTYEGGNMCNMTHHYSLTVQINCNSNIDVTTYALDKQSLNTPCDPKVIMNTPVACPIISTGALGRFIDDYAYWLAVPFILLGGFLFTAGGKQHKATLAIFSTLSIAFGLLYFIYVVVLPYTAPTWTVWIVGFVCLGLGAGMGFASARWPPIGITFMGLSMGVFIGYAI